VVEALPCYKLKLAFGWWAKVEVQKINEKILKVIPSAEFTILSGIQWIKSDDITEYRAVFKSEEDRNLALLIADKHTYEIIND